MSDTFDNQDGLDHFKRAVEDVVQSTDLYELINPLIEGGLRQQGASFTGLCPFHADTSPSFSVTPSKGVYRCWSCSAGMNGSSGGDAISFVRRYYNKSFKEACEHLAQMQGVDLRAGRQPLRRSQSAGGFNAYAASSEPSGSPSVAPTSFEPRHPIVNRVAQEPVYETSPKEQKDALALAHRAFFNALATNNIAKAYLTRERGLAVESLKRFRIGFAPKSFDFLSKSFTDYHGNKALIESGLIKPTSKDPSRFFDVFRGRVLFAVRDEVGDIVGFGGRLLEEDSFVDRRTGKKVSAPKYLNSPESAVFKKSELLFGLFEGKAFIQEQKQAIVVEGYMDVLGLASYGVDNAVACMGVAVSNEHVKRLIDHGANQVVMCFDGDRAGREGAARSLLGVLPNVSDTLDARFLLLPDGLDPDDYIKSNGKEAFDALVSTSPDLMGFVDIALSDLDEVAKNDTSEYAQSGYERKLMMMKRWIELAPEGSAVRVQLAKRASEIMNEEKERVAQTEKTITSAQADRVIITPPVSEKPIAAASPNTPDKTGGFTRGGFTSDGEARAAQRAAVKSSQPITQPESARGHQGHRSFNRGSRTATSVSGGSPSSGGGFEDRLAKAIFAAPIAAIEKRRQLVTTANASSHNKERYALFMEWVSWYDDQLEIGNASRVGESDCEASRRLVDIADKVIVTAVTQNKRPEAGNSMRPTLAVKAPATSAFSSPSY